MRLGELKPGDWFTRTAPAPGGVWLVTSGVGVGVGVWNVTDEGVDWISDDEHGSLLCVQLATGDAAYINAAELVTREAVGQGSMKAKVADPNYTPTVEEAMRYPAEFVEGMTETEH